MTASIPLLIPQTPSRQVLQDFITRHQDLLQLERQAEEEQTRLLNSNCSPRLLEQRGLALGGLGISAINIGLGGKSLIELYRPLAYHTVTTLPPHTFRNGESVRIEAHVVANGGGKVKKMSKKTSEEEDGAVEGVVYKVSTEKVVVAVDGGKQIDLPERLRLLKLANSVTFDRMDRTLSHLQRIVLPDPSTPIGSSHTFNLSLIRSLLGLQQPTWLDYIPPTIAELDIDTAEATASKSGINDDVKWFDEGLNDSQKEAIRFCLSAENVACIHGPPGTGKTHTLIELIYQFLSRPSLTDPNHPPRILITTPSNLALDNLLIRLHALSLHPPYSTLLPKGSILRLGHPTKVHRDLISQTLDYQAANGEQGGLLKDVGKELEGHLGDLGKKRGEKGAVKGKERGKKWDEVRELRKEYRQRESKVVTSVVNSAKVVLATCHGAGSKQLNNLLFDICIVDEATQAVEAVCWVPILKSRKLILAGDPQQLPPTILSKNDKIIKKSGKNDKTAERKKVDTVEDALSAGEEAGRDKESPNVESSSGTASPIANKGSQNQSANVQGTIESDSVGQGTEKSDQGVKKMKLGEYELKQSANQSQSPPSVSDDGASYAMTRLDIVDDGNRTQLGPPRTLETTLFDRLERLYGPGIKRVLKLQYRMNEKIASFPSEELYESNLISASSVAKRTLLDLPGITDTSSEEAIDTLSHTVVFFDTTGCEFYERTEGDAAKDVMAAGGGKRIGEVLGEGSKCNENEAEVVGKWARKLISLGVPPSEIAVVTPYQAQVSLISSLLHYDYPEMTIGSVDGLQGQEREAIILSLVRSNPTGEVGFLGEYRRLNVAMTRAKRQLCVVGDSSTVGKGSKYLRKWMDWLEAEGDVRWAGEEGG